MRPKSKFKKQPGHSLICGITQSGKTTLARYIARYLVKKKQRVIVFDPTADTKTLGGDWNTTEVFTDPGEFLEFVEDPKNITPDNPAHIFIDESDEIFSHSQIENRWILKKGRHYGMAVYLITQRPNLIMPTARNQCTTCYMFRLTVTDSKLVLADYGHTEIPGPPLDQGEYLILKSGYPDIGRSSIYKLPGV